MQKSTSEILYAHWNQARAGKPFALRRDINPAKIGAVLPFVFMLEEAEGQLCFRLAGTHICTAFQRELRDAPFSAVWAANSAKEADMLARNTLATSRPIFMNGEIELEPESYSKASILLLPLSLDGKTAGRLIGAVDFGIRGHLRNNNALEGLVLFGAGEPHFARWDEGTEILAFPKERPALFPAAK